MVDAITAHWITMINISDVFDEPREYNGLKIYPVTIRDYYLFNTSIRCMLLDKNSIPDPKIISMTYLEYLFKLANEDNLYLAMMDTLLRMCLHIPQELKDIQYLNDSNKKPLIKIGKIELRDDDFNKLKIIICDQNMVDLPDENISLEARKAFDKAKDYRQKESGRKMAGLEDQICCVLISTSLSLEDISKLTIRKFNKILERVDMKLHYQIYLQAKMGGMVTFKDESFIRHWLSEVEHVDKYSEAKIDIQDVKDKLK